jgi:hypothetical protein
MPFSANHRPFILSQSCPKSLLKTEAYMPPSKYPNPAKRSWVVLLNPTKCALKILAQSENLRPTWFRLSSLSTPAQTPPLMATPKSCRPLLYPNPAKIKWEVFVQPGQCAMQFSTKSENLHFGQFWPSNRFSASCQSDTR